MSPYVAIARSWPDGECRTQRTTWSPQWIGIPWSRHVFVLQNFVVPSNEPLARTVPSGEKSSDRMPSLWAFMAGVRDSPVSPYQVMNSPLSSPLAINSPSRDNANAHTLSQCPSIFFGTTPVLKSQRQSVLSHEPVIIRCLSGKTTSECMPSVCYSNSRSGIVLERSCNILKVDCVERGQDGLGEMRASFSM
jgi:hypothetical protein